MTEFRRRLQPRKLAQWAVACRAATFAFFVPHSGAVPGFFWNGTRNPAPRSGLVERLAGIVASTADCMPPAMEPIRCAPHLVAVGRALKTTDPYRQSLREGRMR